MRARQRRGKTAHWAVPVPALAFASALLCSSSGAAFAPPAGVCLSTGGAASGRPVVDYAAARRLAKPEEYQRLIHLTATQAVAELCSGNLSASTYATALLARAADTECLNLWAAFTPSLVLSDAAAADAAFAASGEPNRPLCGLPVALKDVLDASGYPTVGGTPALEGHFPPDSQQSALVTRLKTAGAVILGKLRMHELGGGDTTLSPVYGPTLNPHNVTHIVGGSSGGNGAALAAHAAVVAICADSGGSCRSPASLTGTVGFRPSTGCNDAMPGVLGMGAMRDTTGVSARTVSDVQLLDAVLSDCATPSADAASLVGLRIGKPNTWWRDVGAESLPALHAALDALTAAGAVVIDVDTDPLWHFYHYNLPDSLFYAAEMPAALALYLAAHNYSVSLQELVARIGTTSTREWVKSFFHSAPSAEQYYTAIQVGVPALRDAWQAVFDGAQLDILALPTTPLPARPISDVEPMLDLNGLRRPFYDVMGKAFMADCVAGIPGISVNAGVSTPLGSSPLYPGNMPVGLMLQARRKHDTQLLAIAAAVEAVLPPPPVAPHVPACAGCTAKIGWVPVAYPPEAVAPSDGAASGSMAYAPDGYALDFSGECAVKEAASGLSFPMVSPFAVKGASVDWASRAGVWTPGTSGQMGDGQCAGGGTETAHA